MNKTLIKKIIVFLFLSFGLSACVYETVQPVTDLPKNVSFQNDLIPLFNQSCNTAGCHDQYGIPPNLSEQNAYTELTTKGWIDLNSPENSIIYQRMIDNKKPMPPSGVMDYSSKQVLSWIKDGAKNN
jgi:hypothetical protein